LLLLQLQQQAGEEDVDWTAVDSAQLSLQFHSL
jgi:hypothetical protein